MFFCCDAFETDVMCSRKDKESTKYDKRMAKLRKQRELKKEKLLEQREKEKERKRLRNVQLKARKHRQRLKQ